MLQLFTKDRNYSGKGGFHNQLGQGHLFENMFGKQIPRNLILKHAAGGAGTVWKLSRAERTALKWRSLAVAVWNCTFNVCVINK